MNEPATPARPFYVTGGTLKPGEPSYVERRADTELFESLLAGEFCYVLTARQMGKSSLMARTAKRLEQAGVASAIVDLTQIGSERGGQAEAQWYFGIANLVHRQLGITVPLRPWWQERADLSSVQRLTDFFRELVLPNVPGRVVIFVDEIDSTIGLPFADDFFAALRACFNARATDEAFERLTFVLLGVATPDQLIRDQTRTPFNIGKRIDLTDFTLDEAQVLASGLHIDADQADQRLERVLHWTGGHPYLTQAVCRAVRDREDYGRRVEEVVDSQVEELFLSSRAQREETNLKHARARLERRGSEGRRLLQIYRRVRRGKPVADQPTSPIFAQLKLVGVVKATDEGRLAVRNRIYEAVFTSKWAKSAMPADRGYQLAAATLATSLAGLLLWYAVLLPRANEATLRAAIRDDAYNVAFDAYSALRANPFAKSPSADLMQEFWEQRALRYALAGDRDGSLLCYLQGLSVGDDERIRRQVGNLVGSDYERLRLSFQNESEEHPLVVDKLDELLSNAKLMVARMQDKVVAITFNPDGRTLVATGIFDPSDRGAGLWDLRSGKILAFPSNLGESGRIVAISPDGRTITTTASEDSGVTTVRFLEAHSGKPLAPLLKFEQPVDSATFSPSGKVLAIVLGNVGKVLRLLDARSGNPLAPPLEYKQSVNAVAFSPDERTIAVASGNLDLLDARSGKPLKPSLVYDKSVRAVVFSPDGHALLVALSGGTVLLLNPQTGNLIRPPLEHKQSVNAIAFSPDGHKIAVSSGAGEGSTVWLWDATSGRPIMPPMQHAGLIEGLAFSLDGLTFATCSLDGIAKLWDIGNESSIAPITLAFEEAVSAVVLSPNGRTFATVFWGGTARFWNMNSEKPSTSSTWHGPASSVVFSPDGRRFVTLSSTREARLWDSVTGKAVGPPMRSDWSFDTIAFRKNGEITAAGFRGNTASVWNARTGKPLGPRMEHKEHVSSVAFNPTGEIAVTYWIATAYLWNVHTGKTIGAPLEHNGVISAVAFSPDSQILAIGSSEELVLRDARSGSILGLPLQIQGSARTIAFSPNGKMLFVATDYWLNAYLWDGEEAVPQSSQLLHGRWTSGFRFPVDCELCLQVALGDPGNSFHFETLRLDGPTDPPIEGDPKELLENWQARLGLKFDEQMKPVPR